MKITLDIPDSEIDAALRTAAESGIGYWAKELDWTARPTTRSYIRGWVVDHNDSRDESKHIRYELDIARGLRMMYQNPRKSMELAGRSKAEPPSWWDANQADAFVQYAAFGELKYG